MALLAIGSGIDESGLPLERALTALADEAEDPRQRELLSHLKSEVNAGSSFAKALGRHPREFSATYVAVIGAATISAFGMATSSTRIRRRLTMPGTAVAGRLAPLSSASAGGGSVSCWSPAPGPSLASW